MNSLRGICKKYKSHYFLLSYRSMAGEYSIAKEIKIPVPYGFIAAKAWGKPSSEPVLALHGWQDNAGTFDCLIPLLNSNLYIVAIDAPGHGWSSHKPIGAFYHYLEIVADLKRIADHFQWSTFSIMGHSLGGIVGVLFASLYSEMVKTMVLLDIVKPASREAHLLGQEMRNGIEDMLLLEKKQNECANPPVYSLKEAHERLIAGLYNQVTPEGASVLLKRGCKPSNCGKGVVFCRDIRVKSSESLHKFSHDDLKKIVCNMKCHLLIIQGNNSAIFGSRTPEVLGEFLKIYEQNCKSFKHVQVVGNHFVHLNSPELVAPHINDFFEIHFDNSLKFQNKI